MGGRLRDAARGYARDVLVDAAPIHEGQEEIPARIFEELGARGSMAVTGSRELGGAGGTVTDYVESMIAIASGCASTAVTMAVTNMVGEVIHRFGSEAQRGRYLPQLAEGGLGAFGLSEAEAGSDPASMRTVATKDESGYLINGTKQWISHGDRARVVVVWARLIDGDGREQGISCFLVEPSFDGFEVVGLEEKMGLRASHTAGLSFDGVRLPPDALLGAPGEGFKIAMAALDGGRIGVASQAIGIALSAVEAVRPHLSTRHPLVSSGMLPRACAQISAARALTHRAAAAKQSGARFTREASMAKLFATEAAVSVTTELLERAGSLPETDMERLDRAFRDARVTMIYEGTSEVQRLVIHRDLCKS